MADRNNAPTSDDLRRLPRWARVALAARCAARVYPFLFRWLAEDARRAPLAGPIEVSLKLAWNAARQADITSADYERRAAMDSLGLEAAFSVEVSLAHHVITSAADAAVASSEAQNLGEGNGFSSNAPAIVANSIGAAYRLPLASELIWQEYELLAALTVEEAWEDESPVDPNLLGPLWPKGKPQGWPDDPQAAEQPAGLSLTIEVPDDWTDEQITAKVREVVDKLDTAYRQLGGRDGLRLLPPTDVTVPAEVLTGVGA